ncbi:MAG: aspartate aminotransferase family protein [Verrucomicrobia bacterium]|nr:aspartate aminotransferase family protein [Verrucomicrobiota bacterium]
MPALRSFLSVNLRARTVLRLLRQYESRNITFISRDGSWPIVWEKAKGVFVWDANGKKYLDLTAAFAVAATGHANPRVVAAGQRQMSRLLHAMGDVHPHALKARLAQELSRLTFERWSRFTPNGPRLTAKTIFCNSGFEAVEAALKTALLATEKPGVIAFSGAYHGLGYGALNATHRGHFRARFEPQLGRFGHFVAFPTRPDQLDDLAVCVRRLFKRKRIGAMLVEPIQGRGGINMPPADFLPLLRKLCDEEQALLIADEVFTGFGRTGKWFACEHSRTIPDVICLGKAITGGFPLSACAGRAALMDEAWPASAGEAIHTSTYLGHPVGCAMALAQIEEIRKQRLVDRSFSLSKMLVSALEHLKAPTGLKLAARGLGLMAGLELRHSDDEPATNSALQIVKKMLHRGYILLPEGEHSNVIALTPPLTISRSQLETSVNALQETLAECEQGIEQTRSR